MDLRLDRLATLYVADPMRWCLPVDTRAIPILMYHAIVEDGEAGVHPYYRTTTAPRMFAEQIASLCEMGYRNLSLKEAVGGLNHAANGAGLSVVITFDDGYSDFYTNAFPILERYGFTASVFLPTAFIADTRRRLKGRECLTWNEVRELERHGIEFGSHTVNHPQLRELDARGVEAEVVASKQTIEDKLGKAVESFAYPYAFPETELDFKGQLRRLLERTGYQRGVCTTVGRMVPGSDRYFLRRLPVNSDDDRRLFQAKLRGSYDWLAKPQYAVKWVKQWRAGKAGQRGGCASRTEGEGPVRETGMYL